MLGTLGKSRLDSSALTGQCHRTLGLHSAVFGESQGAKDQTQPLALHICPAHIWTTFDSWKGAFEPHLALLSSHSWLYAPEAFLMMFQRPSVVQGIKPGSACKSDTVPPAHLLTIVTASIP